jgi:hypothetical protein
MQESELDNKTQGQYTGVGAWAWSKCNTPTFNQD